MKKVVQVRSVNKIELKLAQEIKQFLKEKRRRRNERENRSYT